MRRPRPTESPMIKGLFWRNELPEVEFAASALGTPLDAGLELDELAEELNGASVGVGVGLSTRLLGPPSVVGGAVVAEPLALPVTDGALADTAPGPTVGADATLLAPTPGADTAEFELGPAFGAGVCCVELWESVGAAACAPCPCPLPCAFWFGWFLSVAAGEVVALAAAFAAAPWGGFATAVVGAAVLAVSVADDVSVLAGLVCAALSVSVAAALLAWVRFAFVALAPSVWFWAWAAPTKGLATAGDELTVALGAADDMGYTIY